MIIILHYELVLLLLVFIVTVSSFIIHTYVISAYHHYRCEFKSRSGEVYSIQHYVIKFVMTCDMSVVFSEYSSFLHKKNWKLLKVALNTTTLTLIPFLAILWQPDLMSRKPRTDIMNWLKTLLVWCRCLKNITLELSEGARIHVCCVRLRPLPVSHPGPLLYYGYKVTQKWRCLYRN